ncbi:exported hypothetical protein [Candidatus Sulfopaludibacter sp. SbA3]|nr:exported hypothetical protein [Candidatus Sulfopaludibacter sp. SbA3]
MKPLLLPLLIVCLVLGACKKDIQNEDAVRRGIINYLSKRPDLTAMDVTVTKVAFRQNEADATVHFQAKNANTPGTGLDMSYVLERKGNEWVVKGRAAGSSHGASMPGTMPGPENPHGMGTPAGGMPGSLPPGHPALPPPPAGKPK